MKRSLILLACTLSIGFVTSPLFASAATLPQVLVFDIALSKNTDSNGEFEVSCSALPLLENTRLAFRVDGGKEIEVIELPKKLKGVATKGRAVVFTIRARQRKEATGHSVLRVELHFKYPYEAVRRYIENNPHGRYPNVASQLKALRYLDSLQASSQRTMCIDRAIVLD